MARTTKFEKTLAGMMIAGSTLFFHLTGALLYSSSNHTPLIKSYQELNKRKIELVRKVDEFQRYTPLMKEPFASQYEDSLKNAIKNGKEINFRMTKAKIEMDRQEAKSLYSWAAFFMK